LLASLPFADSGLKTSLIGASKSWIQSRGR